MKEDTEDQNCLCRHVEYIANRNYKLEAYLNLAESYFFHKDYVLATRAYNKLMQLSWQENNSSMENEAFRGMAIQYFYRGELDKCDFLLDRVMRGKKELPESKIRIMVINKLEYN